MKKILSLLLICIMLSCSLTGCGSESVRFMSIGGRQFMVMDTENTEYDILVDVTERTQYIVGVGGYDSGIVLLVDSEGKPILYEGEIPYYGGESWE